MRIATWGWIVGEAPGGMSRPPTLTTEVGPNLGAEGAPHLAGGHGQLRPGAPSLDAQRAHGEERGRGESEGHAQPGLLFEAGSIGRKT